MVRGQWEVRKTCASEIKQTDLTILSSAFSVKFRLCTLSLFTDTNTALNIKKSCDSNILVGCAKSFSNLFQTHKEILSNGLGFTNNAISLHSLKAFPNSLLYLNIVFLKYLAVRLASAFLETGYHKMGEGRLYRLAALSVMHLEMLLGHLRCCSFFFADDGFALSLFVLLAVD